MLWTHLAEHALFAGFSDSFSDLYEIHRYYQLAITAESLARKLGGSDVISRYNNYKLWAMASDIPKDQREQYLSAVLRQLWRFDQENHTEYVPTLFAFLENGTSLAGTAQKLYVHWNTVVYRIEKCGNGLGWMLIRRIRISKILWGPAAGAPIKREVRSPR